MKTTFSVFFIILFSGSLLAQDILYSEITKVSMWNEKIRDWITILERDDEVTFTLTKDRKTILMYCKGSGSHFKFFYKENGKDMMWYSQDTAFYNIMSSEVANDIEGNTTINFITRSGIKNEEYYFDYYKKEKLFDCIFYDATGRVVRNRFIIKYGTIK